MKVTPTPLMIGPGLHQLTVAADWDNPRLLTDVIVSMPLRGSGTEDDPYYRAFRLSLTDGTFVCEIQPHAAAGGGLSC